jgi:hypothetical protein
VVSFTSPSDEKLYQAAYLLHGVSGSQATRTCDASENFFTRQDAKRDAARNALMRLESSPDRAFTTAWTGNRCQEGRTALGIMTSPHKLGQSHEAEDIEFAAERENSKPRCAFDDCPLPPYQDANGRTHACCSKSHELLLQTGWTRTYANLCAITECDRAAHQDETGFIHPCCSKSHADELHTSKFVSVLAPNKRSVTKVSMTWSCLRHTAQPTKKWAQHKTSSTSKDLSMLSNGDHTQGYIKVSTWQLLHASP